jgi:hypothetical protein
MISTLKESLLFVIQTVPRLQQLFMVVISLVEWVNEEDCIRRQKDYFCVSMSMLSCFMKTSSIIQ